MVKIRTVNKNEKDLINELVTIHINTFEGFFLTFMGRGFLRQMYKSYCEHEESGLLVAEIDGKPQGFLAFSGDFSGIYKFMIKKRLLFFAFYSVGAFFRRPSAFIHIISAFLKPSKSKREEKYVELSSIGVNPEYKSRGIGSLLITELKNSVDFSKYEYITLETDCVNNDAALNFYQKNGFIIFRTYETLEGRKMNELRYRKNNN